MKTQHLFVLAPLSCGAYTLQHHHQRHPTFTSSIGGTRGSSSTSLNPLRTDTETLTLDSITSYDLKRTISDFILDESLNLRQVEAVHGMPWKSSVDPKVVEEDLLYMPFWEWHMKFIEENLTNLKVEPCHNGKNDFSYKENLKKKARIVNLCASSDEYRKIRMTYYDAGEATQVFNAVMYPDPELNLPILGVDILCFNRKKYLAIVDFQPLHENEEDHASRYEHLLKPIKEKYDSLKGRMSSKFYDETQYFSQQMLFARFDDEEIVSRDLFPAFKSYVQTHLDLVRSTERKPENVKFVLECQQDYDTYSADRDPATGLFAAMFGAEWADEFVHDFLFSMSERTKGDASPLMPFIAGPPSLAATAGQSSSPNVASLSHRP